jgi:hypothetical protein
VGGITRSNVCAGRKPLSQASGRKSGSGPRAFPIAGAMADRSLLTVGHFDGFSSGSAQIAPWASCSSDTVGFAT